MRATDYEDWVEGIVGELAGADPKLIAHFGRGYDHVAYQWLVIQLGLSDGDIVKVGDDGNIVLETPMSEIDRRITAVRKALANGGSALDLPWLD